jgi:hypothetical protein
MQQESSGNGAPKLDLTGLMDASGIMNAGNASGTGSISCPVGELVTPQVVVPCPI